MESEHVDPAFQYTDDKFAVIEKSLLKSLRDTASLLVSNEVHITLLLISQHKINSPNTTTQLAAWASKAMAEIKTSNDPLSIADNFYTECSNHLTSLGIKSTRLM